MGQKFVESEGPKQKVTGTSCAPLVTPGISGILFKSRGRKVAILQEGWLHSRK